MGNGRTSAAAVVLDADVAFFDIDIGRAVFAHGSELDQMAVGLELAEGEEEIERADDVVHLGEDGVLAVDHRIGRGALLGKMDHGVGAHGFDGGSEKIVVGDIAGKLVDVLAGQLAPDAQAFGQGLNGGQSLNAQFMVPLAAGKIVDNRDRMTFLRQIQGSGPPAVSVTTQDADFHVFRLCTPSDLKTIE